MWLFLDSLARYPHFSNLDVKLFVAIIIYNCIILDFEDTYVLIKNHWYDRIINCAMFTRIINCRIRPVTSLAWAKSAQFIAINSNNVEQFTFQDISNHGIRDLLEIGRLGESSGREFRQANPLLQSDLFPLVGLCIQHCVFKKFVDTKFDK